MKAVIQRVEKASVSVDGKVVGEIGPGVMTLLGIERGDDEQRLRRLVQKICELRIFQDAQGKMNRSLIDVRGGHLLISQFTLAGDTRSGRRPSFTAAERPERARALYEQALEISRSLGVPTAGGIFQADMKVSLINDGPVTFLIEA